MRKFLFAATAALFATQAHAVSITIGWWDNIVGGSVTPIYSQSTGDLFTLSGVSFGPTFTGVLSALQTSDGYYEAAINDIFSNNVGTARIYATFSGITTVDNALTLPTIFQRTENLLPGWTLQEQIFVCGSVLFCDNFVTGSGTLVGLDNFTNRLGTDFLTLTGIAPGQPFNITEVFHLVSTGANAHLAGAILTQPIASVPGPIVGAGIPGLAALALLWLARRRKQTA